MANVPKIVKSLTSLQKIEKNRAIKKNMAKKAATPAQVKAHAAEIRAMLKTKAGNK